MSKIEVNGKQYVVVESLPFHGAGCKAKMVKTADGEKVAVFRGGRWSWWTTQDRLGWPKQKTETP